MASIRKCGVSVGVIGIGLFLLPATASAHHLMGGQLPRTSFAGLLSGLAHPVIGLDHLMVVIALGMLSWGVPKGRLISCAFLLAALSGTGIHLLRLDFPAAEVVIAASVACFGALLVAGPQRRFEPLAVVAFGAGIVHGYAYGESIVGAEPTPLAAYLIGFTLIQLVLVMGARALARAAAERLGAGSASLTRAFGIVMGLSGIVLLAKALGGLS